MKQLAETVINSYRSGTPVVIFDENECVLHGWETLETIVGARVSIQCLTIRGVNRQAFESTDMPEFCEAARRTWLEGNTN